MNGKSVSVENASRATARQIVLKTMVTHTVTYFLVGVAAFTLLDYPALIRETELGTSMRALTDPAVLAGPLLQPARGLLFGVVFYLLREPLFSPRGWLPMWAMLVLVGIFDTFAAAPVSIEGIIYTRLPLSLHLTLLPELLVQSLLLSWVVFHWVNHPGKRWVTWTMWAAFVVVLPLPALALVQTLLE